MNIRSVGGSSVRGVGYFFLVVGVIGAVITIFMILFGFTSTILWEAFFGLVALAIFGYILIGVYILPEWIRVPMLLLGKYRSMRGPGIFWVAPWIYVIPFALDIRVITTSFSAEQTLTKDNVPVNVDAVLFWQVIDPFKASIKVQDYRNAIMWASQTSLRDIIGKTDLSAMLVGREQIARELGVIIDARTQEWGVKSIAVEVRDVVIPTALQDAMSRQAQAERERQARIILASSEEQIAQKFLNAAEVYENDAVALNLRAMNILYESMKEKGTWVIVPSQMANLLGNLTQIPVPNIQKKTGPTRAEEYPRNEEEQ
jgi:regulator of protease activity HflC (stomatin/prohibitin superfamily)